MIKVLPAFRLHFSRRSVSSVHCITEHAPILTFPTIRDSVLAVPPNTRSTGNSQLAQMKRELELLLNARKENSEHRLAKRWDLDTGTGRDLAQCWFYPIRREIIAEQHAIGTELIKLKSINYKVSVSSTISLPSALSAPAPDGSSGGEIYGTWKELFFAFEPEFLALNLARQLVCLGKSTLEKCVDRDLWAFPWIEAVNSLTEMFLTEHGWAALERQFADSHYRSRLITSVSVGLWVRQNTFLRRLWAKVAHFLLYVCLLKHPTILQPPALEAETSFTVSFSPTTTSSLQHSTTSPSMTLLHGGTLGNDFSISRDIAFIDEVDQQAGPLMNRIIVLTREFWANLTWEERSRNHVSREPMIVPPRPWTNHNGPHYILDRSKHIMKASLSPDHSLQRNLLLNADPCHIFATVSYLSSIPWKINTEVLSIIESVALKDDFIGVSKQRPLFASCNEDEQDPELSPVATFRELQQRNQRRREQKMLNVGFKTEATMWRGAFQLANQYRDQPEIYFPYDLDFRGRAYVMAQNLQHMGDDSRRGLMQFARKKQLGSQGLRWLKLHCANMYGKDKVSFVDRVAFIDAELPKIMAIGESMQAAVSEGAWWRMADKPCQCLAVCLELNRVFREAARTKINAEDVTSSFAIQMDGSCNGIQHFVALTRDEAAAKYVNMVPIEETDVPGDAYSAVLKVVKQKLEWLAEEAKNPYAQLLVNKVNRKTVKQTVMTVVYGVTDFGAKEQVQNYLKEQNLINVGSQRDLIACSMFLSRLVLTSNDEVFRRMKEVKDWLQKAAEKFVQLTGHPVSWTTPLGLPVAQPYNTFHRYRLRGHDGISGSTFSLLPGASEFTDYDYRKQSTAFPPNFVHSLDATHMLYTAERCRKENIDLASVHDCFWTHAADGYRLSQIIREEFVRLHKQPLLQQLRTSLCHTHSDMKPLSLPELPPLGSFDLENVKKAIYFFS